jgi:hypothetical protein
MQYVYKDVACPGNSAHNSIQLDILLDDKHKATACQPLEIACTMGKQVITYIIFKMATLGRLPFIFGNIV